MNDLFAKYRHITEIIKTICQVRKAAEAVLTSVTMKKVNKSVHKDKINNEK